MLSTTRVKGRLALRPCYVGARANQSQVDGFLEAVLRIGEEMERDSQQEC